ncbi:MAG: low specificity L-threonine aldolase, partial [Schaalia odontolytica]
LFEESLYLTIGDPAVAATARIRAALQRAGYVVTMDSPTNLTFVALDQAGHERLSRKVHYSIWETLPDGRLLARIGTSWATPEEDVAAFEEALAR